MESRIACNFACESLCRKGVVIITVPLHFSEKSKLPPVQSDVSMVSRVGHLPAGCIWEGLHPHVQKSRNTQKRLVPTSEELSTM